MVQLHETVKVSCAEETLALSSGKRNSLSYLNQRRSIFGTVRSKSYAVTTSLYNSETLLRKQPTLFLPFCANELSQRHF